MNSFPSFPPTATPNLTWPTSSRACSNSPTPRTTWPAGRVTWATTARRSPSPPSAAPNCAELDAYYARLYGLTRDELRYILDPADVLGDDYPSETFRVLKNKELREFGEYRTQRLVLAAWDAMAAHAVSPPFPAQSPA